MRNNRGGIQLIALVGVVIALIFIFFIVLCLIKVKQTEEKKVDNNNVSVNTVTPLPTPIVKEPIQEESTKITSTDFTLGFLKKENNKKNMLYSPLSIKYALKMLQDGANGNTYTQINNVVGPLSLPKYNNIDNTLSLANGIFIRDTYFQNIKKDYIEVLTNQYNAEVVQDKFANAKNANKWIENKTLGIIKNMLKDNLVQNPDLQMLLINALAIDMEWKTRFDTKDTHGDTFYLENGTEMQATMMNDKTSSEAVSYYLDKNLTALSMDLQDYDGVQMEFLALMPQDNIEQYIKELNIEKIEDIAKKLKKASDTAGGVRLKIPKFSFDYDLKLKQDLIEMGITDAFNPDLANLSKMADIQKTGKNLYVSDALHKANIDFTEKGVKAAAVTVFAVMEATAMVERIEPIEVTINKPFVFIIRDKKNKEIWFTGTVYEPNSWENDKAQYEMRY